MKYVFSLMPSTDYVKFMCGAVVSGGGLFPWLMGSLTKAIQWVWSPGTITEHAEH